MVAAASSTASTAAADCGGRDVIRREKTQSCAELDCSTEPVAYQGLQKLL